MVVYRYVNTLSALHNFPVGVACETRQSGNQQRNERFVPCCAWRTRTSDSPHHAHQAIQASSGVSISKRAYVCCILCTCDIAVETCLLVLRRQPRQPSQPPLLGPGTPHNHTTTQPRSETFVGCAHSSKAILTHGPVEGKQVGQWKTGFALVFKIPDGSQVSRSVIRS